MAAKLNKTETAIIEGMKTGAEAADLAVEEMRAAVRGFARRINSDSDAAETLRNELDYISDNAADADSYAARLREVADNLNDADLRGELRNLAGLSASPYRAPRQSEPSAYKRDKARVEVRALLAARRSKSRAVVEDAKNRRITRRQRAGYRYWAAEKAEETRNRIR